MKCVLDTGSEERKGDGWMDTGSGSGSGSVFVAVRYPLAWASFELCYSEVRRVNCVCVFVCVCLYSGQGCFRARRARC